MIDVSFDIPAWESALEALENGSRISAAQFLALMEQETEEDFEEALGILERKDILPDVRDLPKLGGSGETAVRLRREGQLVKEGKLPEGLEENDPLRLYLQELSSIPAEPLSMDEMRRCADGDPDARQKLMGSLLPKVVEMACELAGHSVLLMDLIQEGSMGLWQAILAYSGGDFDSPCRRGIRRAMAFAVLVQARENGVGQKMRQALEDYRSVDERLLSELGRNATLEEIAAELHMTPEETQTVAQMLDTVRTVNRAKAQTREPEETADDEMAVEDTAYFQMRQRISELLSVLEESDAKLLSLRFGLEGGLPLTLEETSRRMGLTPEEATAKEAAALAILRDHETR